MRWYLCDLELKLVLQSSKDHALIPLENVQISKILLAKIFIKFYAPTKILWTLQHSFICSERKAPHENNLQVSNLSTSRVYRKCLLNVLPNLHEFFFQLVDLCGKLFYNYKPTFHRFKQVDLQFRCLVNELIRCFYMFFEIKNFQESSVKWV